jgi:hypothetical protein
LYGYENLSLVLREQHILRVLENRVLRRIFKPTRDEVTGGKRKTHNEEFHNLKCPSNTIRTSDHKMCDWRRV